MLIEGPAVTDLSDAFRRTWREGTGDAIDLPRRPDPFEEGIQVQVLETDPRRPETQLRAMLEEAISKARERIRIATP